jgi:hypothetical protein
LIDREFAQAVQRTCPGTVGIIRGDEDRFNFCF